MSSFNHTPRTYRIQDGRDIGLIYCELYHLTVGQKTIRCHKGYIVGAGLSVIWSEDKRPSPIARINKDGIHRNIQGIQNDGICV